MFLSCSLKVTCLERDDLLAALYVMFLCFCHFQYSGLSQVWYMIVPFLIFVFFFALPYENIFEGKSYLVKDELMLEKGHLLTTNGWKIKE